MEKDRIHSNLKPYIKTLLQHEFGLIHQKCEIDQVTSGCLSVGSENGDRFRLKVPFYRKTLIWSVLMNGEDVYEAPDIIMEDDHFLLSLNDGEFESSVPSLRNWNPKDVKCLLNVVLELYNLYRLHQVRVLQCNQSLQRYLFEYETLTAMNNLTKDDFDVYIDISLRNVTVVFYIATNIDISVLPYSVPAKPHNVAVLVVEYHNNSKTVPQLIVCQGLDDILDSSFSLPNLPIDTSLLDYYPTVIELLQNKVLDTGRKLNLRKELYSHFLQRLERSVIHGDSIFYRELSCLLESHGLSYVLTIQLPINFPDEQPKVQLHLIHSAKGGQRKLDNYSYNSRWTCREISNKILTEVQDIIDKDATHYV